MNNKKNDNVVRLLGTAAVKTTILESKSGKILEVENRVDPQLWHTKKVNILENKIYKIAKGFLLPTIISMIVILLSLKKIYELQTEFLVLLVVNLLLLIFVISVELIPPCKELKELKNMSPVIDDYYLSFSCLDVKLKDYKFLYTLDTRELVSFCVKENENMIMFNYVNWKGDLVTYDIEVSIRKNIHAPHTKIIMYENHLECIIPYKLQEKAPEQPGADD